MPFFPSFGVGELLLIAFVALFIVGPERLPEVMAKLGVWFAHTRHFVQGMFTGWSGEDAHTMTATKPKEKASK